MQRTVAIGPLKIANDRPLLLIAGPCAIESRAHALETCGALVEIAESLAIPFIYKSSYDKANRTSVDSPRGVGMSTGLDILAEVRSTYGCPVLTDVHDAGHYPAVAEAVSVLQLPAFLCRQTDLLQAAGATGKPINIKKGQFLAPWDMAHVAAKVASTGNRDILLTERGVSFGYNTLVADMRSLPILAQSGYPVIFDATHAVQQPGGLGGRSGGQRAFVPALARAAASIGVAGLFIETHQDPDRAPSDRPNMVALADLPGVLSPVLAIDRIAKTSPLDVALG